MSREQSEILPHLGGGGDHYYYYYYEGILAPSPLGTGGNSVANLTNLYTETSPRVVVPCRIVTSLCRVAFARGRCHSGLVVKYNIAMQR